MKHATATHPDQQQRLFWLANVAKLAAYAAAQNATEPHHEAQQGHDLKCLADALDGLAFELERLAD